MTIVASPPTDLDERIAAAFGDATKPDEIAALITEAEAGRIGSLVGHGYLAKRSLL